MLFKMAAATPDVPITQLLDKIATKFHSDAIIDAMVMYAVT